ncbi:MAG: PIG-L family deacetylase [Spirochaetales bacterium]|nr:PIG-L family deacetylase [Spirochaetales bacterium]
MRRILAFGCHPDDVEFMAAGTLALLVGRGWEVHVATMTGGEAGSATLSSQEIREIRLQEAARAAAVIGAHYHYAGGKDLEVEYNQHYRQLAVRVVREVDPDVVLTHYPVDYLIDHEETSRLVRNAAFIASVPLFDCGLPLKVTGRIPHLYYWNAMNGIDNLGRPIPVQFGVDVGSVMETKTQMLAAHASQREWLQFINKFDAYLEEMKKLAQKQGALIGRPCAECFVQHVGNGHPTDNLLREALGELAVETAG